MDEKHFHDLARLEERWWWFVGMRRILTAMMAGCVPPAGDLLDAGCGSGGTTAWLVSALRTRSAVAIDCSRDALRWSSRHALFPATCSSIQSLPFRDESFDIVTSFDVIDQLSQEGRDRIALSEFLRVLRPGGICVLRVPAFSWLRGAHDRAISSARRYTLPELRALLCEIGFTLVRETYANALLLPLVFLKRRLLEPLGFRAVGSDLRVTHPLLGRSFLAALSVEGQWLKLTGRGLPVGVSLICIARK